MPENPDLRFEVPNPDIFTIPTPQVPTEEELAAKRAEFSQTPRGIALRETVDLRDWITRAEAAGIPFIPAFGPAVPESLTIAEVYDLMEVTPKPEAVGKLSTLEAGTVAKLLEIEALYGKSMWRWNLCAPLDLKSQMGCPEMEIFGENPTPATSLDDPRFVDIAYDLDMAGLQEITTLIRPWAKAHIVEEFPVEFRVFVNENGETVTTSYYPQRPLGEEWLPAAQKATEYAKALRPFVKEGVAYSADFIALIGGEVSFLEGGPHFLHGGHPCCLNPQTFKEDGRIVLAPEAGAVEGY